jgi:hypothetical protein
LFDLTVVVVLVGADTRLVGGSDFRADFFMTHVRAPLLLALKARDSSHTFFFFLSVSLIVMVSD